MAAALTGVQRFQPALVTAPTDLSLPASAAAAFRATALARVPPNQAARPTSWRERDSVLRAMAELLRVDGWSAPRTRPFALHASDLPGGVDPSASARRIHSDQVISRRTVRTSPAPSGSATQRTTETRICGV